MKTQQVVSAFLEAKQSLSPRTLEQYRQALDHLVQQCPELPDKPHPLRIALSKETKVWVRDSCWRAWQSFFHWYCFEDDIPNPMEKVERPKLPEIEMRALEPLELAHVLAAAQNLRDKAIVALAIDSGVRASEFGRLRKLDIGSNTIWLWGKGRKRLQVPISLETRQLLDLLVAQEGSKEQESLIFVQQNGQPISRFVVYRIVRKCMNKADIAGPKRGPHCLRHSLGTNYIANGGDAFSLKRIMRHTNIATTQKYVHLAMHTVVEHHRQYSPLRDALRASQGILIEQEVEEILAHK